jgi:hypothetical protein
MVMLLKLRLFARERLSQLTNKRTLNQLDAAPRSMLRDLFGRLLFDNCLVAFLFASLGESIRLRAQPRSVAFLSMQGGHPQNRLRSTAQYALANFLQNSSARAFNLLRRCDCTN